MVPTLLGRLPASLDLSPQLLVLSLELLLAGTVSHGINGWNQYASPPCPSETL